RHRAHAVADRPGADRAAREDVPVLAKTVRRGRLYQSGVSTGGPAVAVPPPHQRDGHPYAGTDRLRARGIRTHRQGAGGHLSTAPEIRRVETSKDLARFIDLPYRLHRRDLNWVPPFRAEVKKLLDRAPNPFFQHAQADYFIAP